MTSRALGEVVFRVLDSGLDTAMRNAAHHARLCMVNPEDLEVALADDQSVSGELDQYGVDSATVSAAAPAPDGVPAGRPGR